MSDDQTIVPGIVLSATGQATVDSTMSKVLFDYAIELEETTDLPVDVQHVLAAIVLAARNGELDSNTELKSGDSAVQKLLVSHVRSVFETYGGRVGDED